MCAVCTVSLITLLSFRRHLRCTKCDPFIDDGGHLCVTVLYVRGSKSPWSVMKPGCSSESHCCCTNSPWLMELTSASTIYLPASGSCNISVTDLDAVGNINATLAVKYIDVIVVGPSSTTDSVHHTATTILSYQQRHWRVCGCIHVYDHHNDLTSLYYFCHVRPCRRTLVCCSSGSVSVYIYLVSHCML